MRGRKYIPTKEGELFDWVNNIYVYAKANHQRWGVMAPEEEMVQRLNVFKAKLAKCKEPTKNAIDVFSKNNAKKLVVKDIRGYVQGLIMRNVRVSDDDRKLMVLPVFDTKPTPIGEPLGLVTATFKYPSEGALELKLAHLEGTPYDERANYGIKIKCSILSSSAPPPTDVEKMPDSRFTRKKKELYYFDRKDKQKTAHFCMRYENSKGWEGKWGPIVSAVIT